MNYILSGLVVAAGGLLFACQVSLGDILHVSTSTITALSIITAAVFVRLNRGIPTLDWKGAAPTERAALTSSILQVTGEYAAIVGINAIFLVVCLFFVAVGIGGETKFIGAGQKLLSGLFGALAALSLVRMAYVVWRDYDIVRLQKRLIDAAAANEEKAQQSLEAASRRAAMARSPIQSQPPVEVKGWDQ